MIEAVVAGLGSRAGNGGTRVERRGWRRKRCTMASRCFRNAAHWPQLVLVQW